MELKCWDSKWWMNERFAFLVGVYLLYKDKKVVGLSTRRVVLKRSAFHKTRLIEEKARYRFFCRRRKASFGCVVTCSEVFYRRTLNTHATLIASLQTDMSFVNGFSPLRCCWSTVYDSTTTSHSIWLYTIVKDLCRKCVKESEIIMMMMLPITLLFFFSSSHSNTKQRHIFLSSPQKYTIPRIQLFQLLKHTIIEERERESRERWWVTIFQSIYFLSNTDWVQDSMKQENKSIHSFRMMSFRDFRNGTGKRLSRRFRSFRQKFHFFLLRTQMIFMYHHTYSLDHLMMCITSFIHLTQSWIRHNTHSYHTQWYVCIIVYIFLIT